MAHSPSEKEHYYYRHFNKLIVHT